MGDDKGQGIGLLVGDGIERDLILGVGDGNDLIILNFWERLTGFVFFIYLIIV